MDYNFYPHHPAPPHHFPPSHIPPPWLTNETGGHPERLKETGFPDQPGPKSLDCKSPSSEAWLAKNPVHV